MTLCHVKGPQCPRIFGFPVKAFFLYLFLFLSSFLFLKKKNLTFTIYLVATSISLYSSSRFTLLGSHNAYIQSKKPLLFCL
ncbi:hypothetical protein BCR42DRAFT_40907 [Absidia repens]|uniref:Uncharacterized protein n=1 Tax=Absidia repens TaxID=90262 RepID=A0A1X2IFI7_9FUNG|nr:hypothetical protein BCR42DRAFT_40907 [Absidia repens]